MTNGNGIGADLKAWRTAQKVDQHRAARLCGISQTMVALIESGKRQPGKYNAKQIRSVIAAGAPPAVDVPAKVEPVEQPPPAETTEPSSDAALLDDALAAMGEP